jgi:ATP-dependent helicase Lhr and Lhr-like helicase
MPVKGQGKEKKRSTRAASATESGEAALSLFHPVTAEWFRAVFDQPTSPQRLGWPAIAKDESTLILAPTGTGKTLTAFLWCLDSCCAGQQTKWRAAALSISAR